MRKREFEHGVIYNGGCLDVMPAVIEDHSIDMIIADLPYEHTSNDFDKNISVSKLWPQYKRMTKNNGAIILTAKGRFFFERYSSNESMFRYEWVWKKNNGANFAHVGYRPFNVHEYVMVFYQHTPSYHPQFFSGKPYTQKR